MTSARSPHPARHWALVGRAEELDYVAQARRDGVPAVVVGGAQGVGRSRLAGEAMAAARLDRWATEQVDGAAATASIPFGAVAHLAPPDAATAGDALGVLLATTDHLRARAARRPLMIVVDDAHHLDEASLALVRRLVGLAGLFLVVTVRSDEVVPLPVVSLWKDGTARRLELQPLSRDETHRLVTQELGGDVGPDRVRWLWDHSLGNPLYLRELVLSGRGPASGQGPGPEGPATEGPTPPGARLTELVRARLGQLDDDQRGALEAVVVGGPLPTAALEALVPPAAVASLLGRGLLVERDDGAEATVTLAHPVHGVVLGGAMASGHARRLRGRLLDLLDARDDGSPRSAVRLATLRLDQGVDLDAQQLVVAARYAQAAFPQALAEKLAGDAPTVDALTAAVATGEPAMRPTRHDLDVAERLARAAWDTDPTVAAGLSLSTVLVARGRGADARALMADLDPRANDPAARVQLALARAALLFWVLGQADDALDVLDEAEGAAPDAAAHTRLRRLRAGIALNVGRMGEAHGIAADLLAVDDQPEPLAAMAAATGAAALALQGRPQEAIDLVDRFLPVALAHTAEVSEVLGQLMLARQFAARVLGRFDEAEAIAYACHRPAAEQGSVAGMAVFTASLGQIALDRGRPVTARRRLREADVLLSEYDSFGYRPYVLACLAQAVGQAGVADDAHEAVTLARAVATQPRYFDSDLTLAEAWSLAADGRMDAAADCATTAAAEARSAGLAPFEAAALHARVRFGRPQATSERLRDLAAASGSPLVDLYARHAAAAVEGDGRALDEVAGAFEETGATLLAAEAAAQASDAHERAGRTADARRSLARSRALAVACPGARTPALRLAAGGPTLTAREREVAALAAEGLTSRAIAERLVLSPRTVESHLYRIFAKLGISDRSELSDLL